MIGSMVNKYDLRQDSSDQSGTSFIDMFNPPPSTDLSRVGLVAFVQKDPNPGAFSLPSMLLAGCDLPLDPPYLDEPRHSMGLGERPATE